MIRSFSSVGSWWLISFAGYGMNAYLDLIRYMMILFLFITIFSLPAMTIFAKYGAISGEYMGVISQYSRGNMGDASVVCKSAPLGLGSGADTISLTCPIGTFSNDVYLKGIIPSTVHDASFCTSTYDDLDCDAYINEATFTAALEASCFGQVKCQIPNLASYVIAGAPEKCTSGANFFTQIACTFPDEEQA